MRNKIKITLVIILLLSISTITGASNKVSNKKIETLIDDAELPNWNEGNYWKYDMDFIFITRNDRGKVQLNIDAKISDMVAGVTDLERQNGIDNYVLTLNGQITGDVSLLDKFDVASLDGDFSGNAYIGVDNLAINKFDFNVNGKVDIPVFGNRDIDFDMEMGFSPNFDFLDFPINENEPTWQVDIQEAFLEANVYIDILGGYTKEYSESRSFVDNLTIDRIDTINLPQAGNYECFVISGDWGKTSELWYAPDAGYLVKVNEVLDWNNGEIESTFDLELLDTNFDVSNHPPEKPTITNGPSEGEEQEQYTFSAKTTDKEGDKINYKFDWGDGTETDWTQDYESGETCQATHSFENKGTYNIMVKAKDENDLESTWSESHTIMIYGNPHITVTINKIKFRDEIDVLSEAEWFYRLNVEDKEITNHNTDNGKYNGNWVQSNTWNPNKDHEFEIENREASIKIKLMDHDEGLEGDKDDLADVSGCNHPDNDGADDSTPEKRGAIYHGKYDIINKELAEYSENPDDNSDKVIPSQDIGMYITSGDFDPDASTEFEGGVVPDPENDAKIWFTITTDYISPQASIKISNQPERIRTNSILKFKGSVTEGAPDYSWEWKFGDGTTSNKQNPEHTYSKSGQYTIELTVTDKFGQKDITTLTIDVYKNQKPNNLIINGPSQGKKGEIQSYSFKAEDNDGDKLYYMIEWGDGTETGWLGPFLSGNEITKTKTWDKRGSYSIKFTVKDEYDATNSKTKSVSMPKQKNIFPRIIEKMFENLIKNFDFDLPKIFNFSLKTKY